MSWREEFSTAAADRQLAAWRKRRGAGGGLAPLTPDEIDYEMEASPCSRTVIELQNVTQAGLEHFVKRYGSTYRSIHLTWATGVRDLSPLSDLRELECVVLSGLRCDSLWDMSRNAKLRVLAVDSCKRLTARPAMLETAPSLETVWYLGGAESTHPMASLAGFAGLPAIREIRLQDVRLQDRSLDFLATVPTLETFDFEASMFTTEEIAWMAARFPNLGGMFLRAYGPAYFGSTSWVRVSGARKPELCLPEDQARLDRYVAAFDALVRKFSKEEK